MAFQSTVRYDQGSGVPGEKAYDGPTRAESGVLALSAVVGTILSEDPAKAGYWKPGVQAGALRYAMLTTPKQYASIGTSAGGPLAPTLTLPANREVELASMGQFFALASNADARPGHLVYFNNTTGVIVTAAPTAAVPATSTAIVGAVVAPLPGGNRATPAVPGMIVVTLNGPMAFKQA